MSSIKQEGKLGEVYASNNADELAVVYDNWSEGYDQFMHKGGYRHPAVCAGLTARHIRDLKVPIIDVGVGTGLVGDLLSLLGYQCLAGIDISEKMLSVARQKGIYKQLEIANLVNSEKLPNNYYAAAIAAGVFTTGHVGSEGFEALSRLVKQNGRLILTIKSATWKEGFSRYLKEAEKSGAIRILERTNLYNSIPGVSTNAPSLAVVIEKLL